MSRPARLATAVRVQTLVELRLTARRGENLLAMLGIPVGLLLLAGSLDGLPVTDSGTGTPGRIEAVLPGILAVAIVATGLVNLGIATAYERSYGVLVRLGVAPLGVPGLLAAKILAVIALELLLALMLAVVSAVIFGWRPSAGGSILLLLPAVALGTAAFAGLGLALAGALRAEAVLLVANVAFLAVIAVGGTVVPLELLPAPVASVAAVLPSAALREVLAGALGSAPLTLGPWLILGLWALAAGVAAGSTFRWD